MGLLSLLLLVADKQQRLEPLHQLLAWVGQPIQYLAQMPAQLADWMGQEWQSQGDLQQAYATSQADLLRLQGRLLKLAALEEENDRLRDLLDSSLKIRDRVLIAELLSINLNPLRQQLMIDKGQQAGVFIGQAVIDAQGIMGQVSQVGPLAATVLLLTDQAAAIPVEIQRNGLRSLAFGTGQNDYLLLPQLPNNADIRVGDQLFSSGLGGVFPSGYPVATVSQVVHNPGQAFASIRAKPAARLDSSRHVLLVWGARTTEQVLQGE